MREDLKDEIIRSLKKDLFDEKYLNGAKIRELHNTVSDIEHELHNMEPTIENVRDLFFDTIIIISGFWLLVTGCWSLITGFWLLVWLNRVTHLSYFKILYYQSLLIINN